MKEYGKRIRLTPEEENLILKSRAKSIENINDNSALEDHLKFRGIRKKML